MILQSIRGRNFLRIGPEQKLRLDQSGTALVEGKNGSGKSTFIELVLWTLYNFTLRGYKAGQVVNRETKRDCWGQLRFVTDQGQQVKVQRSRKSIKSSTKLRFWVDGVEATPKDPAARQRKLEQLAGLSLQAFLSACVFRSGERWSFTSLTPAKQAEVMDELLGLQPYRKAEELASKQARASKQAAEDCAVKLGELDSEVIELEKELRSVKKKARQFEREKRDQIQALRGDIRSFKPVLQAASKLGIKMEALKLLVEQHYEEKVDAAALWEKQDRRLAPLRLKLQQAQKLSTGTCPTCGHTSFKNTKKRISRLLEELRHQETVTKRARDREDKAVCSYRKAEDNYHDVKSKYDKERYERAGAERAKETLQRQLKIAKRSQSPYAGQCRKIDWKLAQRTTDRKHELATMNKHEKRWQLSKFWADGFRAIRIAIVEDARPYLNEAASKAAAELTSGQVRVEFETRSLLKTGEERESLNVRVENADGASDYQGCSDGERGRVDLCVGLALSAYAVRSSRVNVAFFDEPFDHLDEDGIQRVSTTLNQVMQTENERGKSIFVISHSGEVRDIFSMGYKVERGEDGFTKINVT